MRHGGGRRTKSLQRERKGKEEKKERKKERGDQEGIMYCGVTNIPPLGTGKVRRDRKDQRNYGGRLDRLRCEFTIHILLKY